MISGKKEVSSNYLSKKEKIMLLDLLRDGRAFNTTIARKLNISSQVTGRIRRGLEKEGKIKGYSIDLNNHYFGIHTFVLVLFNIEGANEDKIISDNLVGFYKVIANSITHIGLYAFKDLAESDHYFNSLIEHKEKIKVIETHIFPIEGIIKNCSRNLFCNAIQEFEGKGSCKVVEFPTSKDSLKLLHENEKMIIRQLIKQSNISCKKISSKLNKVISRSAVNRIKAKLENCGVIKRYNINLDYEKLGINVLAFIFVSPEPEIFKLQEELIKKCHKSKYIIGCYRLNEGVALFCGFKNLNELENYSNSIRKQYNELIKIKHIHIISPKGVIKESFDDLYLKLLETKI
jgi:DNA-binding Lrp family transcriptional regulator